MDDASKYAAAFVAGAAAVSAYAAYRSSAPAASAASTSAADPPLASSATAAVERPRVALALGARSASEPAAAPSGPVAPPKPFEERPFEERSELWRKVQSVEDLTLQDSNIAITSVNVLCVKRLPENDEYGTSPRDRAMHADVSTEYNKTGRRQKYNVLVDESQCVLGDIVRNSAQAPVSRGFVRAGPRPKLHFDASRVNAVVLTAGGLCPGLNNVIQTIVRTLKTMYGANKVIGARNGYWGLRKHDAQGYAEDFIELTVENTASIHHEGGTILGSDRGGFDAGLALEFLLEHEINQVFIIGGDGTHRGAEKLAKAIEAAGHDISVCGIPKTIDNDIDIIDRSFGFQSAVHEACRAVLSAKTEAHCVPGGIGIVKLMGRSSGYIAAHAALSCGDCDLCLVPEVPIVLEGDSGIYGHLQRVLKRQGHAVVVVAEGAGAELLGAQQQETDANGVHTGSQPPIGAFLKEKIKEHMKEQQLRCNVKYIDPSYMVRAKAPL